MNPLESLIHHIVWSIRPSLNKTTSEKNNKLIFKIYKGQYAQDQKTRPSAGC